MNAKITLSNMRGMFVVALMALLPAATSAATDYGLTVGGVKVTSANCDNITGTNIKPLDDKVSCSVKYDPDSKTLTMSNVRIHRSGKNNRAIYNTGVDRLKVVFLRDNSFYAADASPLRFEKATTLTSKAYNGTYIGTTYVSGGTQDAITALNNLLIEGAKLAVYASRSAGIIANSGKEYLTIINSAIEWKSDPNVTNYATPKNNIGMKGFKNLQIEASHVALPNYEEIEGKTSQKYQTDRIFYWDGREYNILKKAFPTEWDDKVLFTKAVEVNSDNFPDVNLRNEMLKLKNDSVCDSHVQLPVVYAGVHLTKGDVPKDLNLSTKAIKSTDGLSFFEHLTSLDLTCNGYIKSLCDLTMLKSLKELKCYGNEIKGDAVDLLSKSLPDYTGRPVPGMCYFKYKMATPGESNELTVEQVAAVKAKNWRLYYDDGTEYKGEGSTGIDNVTTGAAGTDAPMYNLSGQRVGKGYKGVVIQNGKKHINR